MSAAAPSLAERLLQHAGAEYAQLLDSLGQALIVRDEAGLIVYANRVARTWFERNGADLLRMPVEAVLDRYRVLDEDGRPVPRTTLPTVASLRQEPAPEPVLLQLIARSDGVRHWFRVRATPLRDVAGQVIGMVTVVDDLTAVRSAEAHTRVLAESGRMLAGSLDYEQTLRNVARAALPELADWCLVELVHDDRREQVVVAHVDPEQRRLAHRLRELEPPRPSPESALREVMATGETVHVPEVSDARLRRVSVSPEQLRVFRALEIRSIIVAPMTVPGRRLGAMSFCTTRTGRRLTVEDVAVAEQLARRAAVAVENARLHTTLEGIAETLQHSLLPSPLPPVPGWEIGAWYRPADDQPRIEVGGDFYEVFETDGTGFATIGDVTGHGVRAATITALLRHGARFASHLEPDPVAIVRRLDEELRRRGDDAMASAMCAALHDHSLLLCSAGHPPAMIVHRDGRVSEAPETGPLLGAFPDSAWHQQRVPVRDGELVLLYTDGVTETAGSAERFGTERLAAFLARHAGTAPQPLLRALNAELERFRGGPVGDDIAALALRPR